MKDRRGQLKEIKRAAAELKLAGVSLEEVLDTVQSVWSQEDKYD